MSQFTDDPQHAIQGMAAGLNSTLTASIKLTATAGLMSTGQLSLDSGNVVASLIGTPRWTVDELARTAARVGHSAALALAYRERGMGFLDQLSGAFSFVIHDPGDNSLIAGIDRMGRMPMYYTECGQGLVLGTSASSVLAHPLVDSSITAQGIYSYIYFHMIPSPLSIYQGLNKLPAAHYLHYRKAGLALTRFWTPGFSEDRTCSIEDLGQQLRSKLRQGVSRCIDPCEKTGAFLSGGLDSSTVTGFMAEISNRESEAYSIGFSAPGYDEMEFARITAKHFGVRLNEYYVTPEDVVDALPLIATSYDEPFGNSSALPAWFCAARAKKDGVQHLLAGDGGDEIFAGNERYAKQSIFEHWLRLPGFLRSSLVEPLVNALPSPVPLASKAKSFLAQANTPLPDRLQSYNFLHRHDPAELFNPEMLAEIDRSEPLQLLNDIYHSPEQASTLNRMLYLDWQITLADNDIRKVSHMGALAGVKITYPMLDDSLVEFSTRVPDAWKLKGGKLRHFYKKSLSGWLPDATITKKKQGFGLPFGVWMQSHEPLRDLAYDNLLSLRKRDYLRDDFIDKLVRLHREGHAAYYGELIWILTVLELWLSHYEQTARATPLSSTAGAIQ